MIRLVAFLETCHEQISKDPFNCIHYMHYSYENDNNYETMTKTYHITLRPSLESGLKEDSVTLTVTDASVCPCRWRSAWSPWGCRRWGSKASQLSGGPAQAPVHRPGAGLEPPSHLPGRAHQRPGQLLLPAVHPAAQVPRPGGQDHHLHHPPAQRHRLRDIRQAVYASRGPVHLPRLHPQPHPLPRQAGSLLSPVPQSRRLRTLPRFSATEVASGEHGDWIWKLKTATDEHGAAEDVPSLPDFDGRVEIAIQASTLCLLEDGGPSLLKVRERPRKQLRRIRNQFVEPVQSANLQEPYLHAQGTDGHPAAAGRPCGGRRAAGHAVLRHWRRRQQDLQQLRLPLLLAHVPHLHRHDAHRAHLSHGENHLRPGVHQQLVQYQNLLLGEDYPVPHDLLQHRVLDDVTAQRPGALRPLRALVRHDLPGGAVRGADHRGRHQRAERSVSGSSGVHTISAVQRILHQPQHHPDLPPVDLTHLPTSATATRASCWPSTDWPPRAAVRQGFCPFQEPRDFLKEMDMVGDNLYVDYVAISAFFFSSSGSSPTTCSTTRWSTAGEELRDLL
ncbi:hypothetical protein CEXT_421631 [Caerostris extrusa]|uniref:Uncharacterized protein n=1 Tax=Caerostris extrusa TaxID=172846 RepID=A0AAV4WVI5_CAEEX|nr:hypothetical protein CEXT_421631 [Caerostris extrusa]